MDKRRTAEPKLFRFKVGKSEWAFAAKLGPSFLPDAAEKNGSGNVVAALSSLIKKKLVQIGQNRKVDEAHAFLLECLMDLVCFRDRGSEIECILWVLRREGRVLYSIEVYDALWQFVTTLLLAFLVFWESCGMTTPYVAVHRSFLDLFIEVVPEPVGCMFFDWIHEGRQASVLYWRKHHFDVDKFFSEM